MNTYHLPHYVVTQVGQEVKQGKRGSGAALKQRRGNGVYPSWWATPEVVLQGLPEAPRGTVPSLPTGGTGQGVSPTVSRNHLSNHVLVSGSASWGVQTITPQMRRQEWELAIDRPPSSPFWVLLSSRPAIPRVARLRGSVLS